MGPDIAQANAIAGAGLSHIDFSELAQQEGEQEGVVPTGPFQLASHRAFGRFHTGQVHSQLPQQGLVRGAMTLPVPGRGLP